MCLRIVLECLSVGLATKQIKGWGRPGGDLWFLSVQWGWVRVVGIDG